MKTLTQIATLLALIAAGLAAAQHGHAGGGPPGKLAVGPANATAVAGQEVDVPITVKGAAGLGALELVLTYDPAVLEARSAERGELVSTNSLVEYYADPSGRLAVALVSQDPVNGDGPVVKAHFVVKGQSGQKCPLRLENLRAWDGKTHLDFLVTAEMAEFTVGGFEWPWWLIPALVAAGVFLMVLLLGLRRRRGT
jgi:hypothetical protein